MFLSDWYFCKKVHLSIKGTAHFIRTMLTLREPNLPCGEKNDALNSLLHMEPLNIVYALPTLVDGLLSPRHRGSDHSEEKRVDQALYAAAVKACIRSIVPDLSKHPYLLAAVDDLECVTYEQLAQYLREEELPVTEGEVLSGYLEMESFASEILALSLLRTTAEQVPEEVREIVDSGSRKPWFASALRGALGGMPWTLAVETLSLCAVPTVELLSYFPKEYWLCCPDKMELAARIFFPDNGGDVDKLLYETFDLGRLTGLYAHTVNNTAAHPDLWLDTGADKEQQKRYVAVLWQITLWSLAAERNPAACLQKLQAYWGIPTKPRRKESSYPLNRIFQQILAKNRNTFLLADARLAVCSPWLLREQERNDARDKRSWTEHPELRQRHLALRAFAVPMIMCRLLRALPKSQKIPSYFLRLLLCYGDAFEFRTIKWLFYQVQARPDSPPSQYPAAIYSLLLCAYSTVQNLGTGRIDNRIADQIVDLIREESPLLNQEYRQPWPHRNLFSESVFITAAHWAHESLSNVTFTQGIEENPWLCGRYSSNGAQVCRWFFHEVWDYVESKESGTIQRSAREATQLSYQVFPDILDHSGRKQPWYFHISEQGNMSTQQLLLSHEMSYEDWASCSPISSQHFQADAYSVGLSLRLRALLKDDTQIHTAEDTWVSEWNKEFYSIQSKVELSRVCRYLISGLLTLSVPSLEQANILLDACKLVIDTIVEFSDDAPFYLRHLAEELSRPLPLGDSSTAMLRQSFLSGLARYMAQEKRLPPAKRKKTQLFPYYMMMIADQFQADPLYAEQLRKYRNVGQCSSFHYSQESARTVSPDQYLGYVLYHRNGDTLQGLSANLQMPNWEPLADSFLPGEMALQGQWQLGIVLSFSEDRKRNEACLGLNLGGGQMETLRYRIDHRHYSEGDLVAVQRATPPQIRWIRYANSRRNLVQAQAFEIRSSHVRLKIDGRWQFSTSDGPAVESPNNLRALRLWSPDICAFHTMSSPEGMYSGGPCLVSQEQLEGHTNLWKPEERDFHTLLAEQFLSPNRPDRQVALVYIEGTDHEFLFSAAPGENYRLTDDVWEPESLRSFQNQLSNYGASEACGLRIRVRLATDSRGTPQVALVDQGAFDDTNLVFQNRFQEGQPLMIRREGAGWIVPSETENGAAAVTVRPEQEPADPTFAEVQVAENGWSLTAQRANCLGVTVLKVQELSPRVLSSDQLERFLNLRAGNRVKLAQIKDRPFYGYYQGKLTSGIPVRVAAESASWDTLRRSPRLFSGREAIVENVHHIPGKAETEAIPCQLSAEIPGLCTGMRGIVSRIANVPKSALPNAENLYVDANVLVNGESILLEQIPRSAFSPAPRGLGEIFVVKRGQAGWTFQIEPRDLFVRALWNVIDHAEESSQQAVGLFLRMTDVHGYGMRVVTQDLEKPILHLWSPEVRSACESTSSTEITAGEGKVQSIGRRFCSTSVFDWAFNTDVVRLVTAKGEYIGEAQAGTFPRTFAAWSGCRPQIHSISQGQYDLRRVFVAAAADRTQEENDQEQAAQWRCRYDEWCETGDFHAIGSLEQRGNGQRVLVMDNLRLPPDGNREAPPAAWVSIIPLQDAAPWVSGRSYSTKTVRAYLHLDAERWTASIRSARPMSLDEFARYFNVSPPGRYLSVTLCFAGYDEEERPRFEWGYGFTLVVEPDQLEIEQALYGTQDLFWGDRIRGFTLELRQEDSQWMLRIPHKKISYELEGRVWRDAVAGVVQQIKVRRVPLTDEVKITKVSVSIPEISEVANNQQHWDFLSSSNAVLDAPSVNCVRNLLSDAEETVILARLDITEDKRHLTVLHFTMVCDELGGTLHEGDILCLVGGEIAPKIKDDSPQIGNDYRIMFSLPPELDKRIIGPLQVSVLRRYFSYDESVLRVQYRKNPKIYSGHFMMVRLRSKPSETADPPIWQGSIIHTIQRPEQRLYDWAANQQTPVVTLGETEENAQTLVEIAPGIISHITTQSGFEQGMLAMLRVEGDALQAESILLGDEEYIPAQGRPVELLIMDGTWRKPEPNSSRPSSFTLAGLPQVHFQDPTLMKREMVKAPPRFAFLRPGGTEKRTYHADDSIPVRAGYLHCDAADCVPYVIPVAAPEERYPLSWRKLSFLDDTVAKIYEHAKRSQWCYHEKFTGILYDEQRPPKKVLWPIGTQFDQIPLLFAWGWRLRYTPKEIPQYAFPARTIMENGLPEGGGWYPVAYSTAHRLYIEFFPGKIVDIPSSILVAGKKQYDLSHTCMAVFSPGDQVQLKMAQVPAGMHTKLQMTNFRFGLRGAFAQGAACLPVRQVLEGGLSLGVGIWHMTIPCEDAGAWTAGDLVSLHPNPDRPLTKVTSSRGISQGDTILISWSGGRFYIPELSERDLWLNPDRNSTNSWINTLLVEAPEKLFAVLPVLPVRVVHKSIVKERPHIWFSYAQTALAQPEPDDQLPCTCIGELPDEQETDSLVLMRAGTYLFTVSGNRFLPGASASVRSAVVRFLAQKRTTLWMYRSEEGWTSGLTGQIGEYRRIQLLQPLSEAGGILCRDQDTLSLCWLPAEEASRAKGADIEALYHILPPVCTAAVQQDQTVSIIQTQESRLQYENLGAHDQQLRVIPRYQVEEKKQGVFRYLCQRYPKGDVFWLISEQELRQECARKSPVPVEITQKSKHNVETVPAGTRRVPLDLSSWIFDGLRCSGKAGGDLFHPDEFKKAVPERFVAYRAAIQGAQSLPKGHISVPLGDCGAKLLSLFVTHLRDRQTDKVLRHARGYLAVWLQEVGQPLAVGAVQDSVPAELDLLPTIAAILLMSEMSEHYEELSGLTVHLTRMLGNLAGGNVHQEILLERWLMSKQHNSQSSLWSRLNRLKLSGQTLSGKDSREFDGSLTQEQAFILTSTCNSILGRSNDPLLTLVARTLLFAAGTESDYEPLYRSAYIKQTCCYRLYQLGKALTPGNAQNLALRSLAPSHINILKYIFGRLRQKDALPITLNAKNMYPISEDNKKWALNKCKKTMEFLKTNL